MFAELSELILLAVRIPKSGWKTHVCAEDHITPAPTRWTLYSDLTEHAGTKVVLYISVSSAHKASLLVFNDTNETTSYGSNALPMC